jgi:hypothetical protein
VSIDAPLSFGQLSSWRVVDAYPPDRLHHANLPATWDLRGLTLHQVKAALRGLFNRHESLRTTFYLRDGDPVRRVNPRATPPICHVDRARTDPDDSGRTTTDLLGRPFAMTDELCWRGVLATTAGTPTFLSMAFSRLIQDEWSIQRLETQFRALVDDTRTPEPATPSSAAPTRD